MKHLRELDLVQGPLFGHDGEVTAAAADQPPACKEEHHLNTKK